VFWGIIHRMILLELLKIFTLALIALTGLILLAGVISEAMKNGFGPSQIAVIIPLLLPSLLPYTVPTSTLFTTCIVYGRLAADNEILALKAAGIHIIHVVWPAVFLGLVTSAATMYFYLDVIPYSGCLLRNKVVSDVEELLYTMLRRDGYIKHPRLNYVIYVREMHGRKLYDVQFMRRSPDGIGYDVVSRAKEAEMRVDTARKQIDINMQNCYITQKDGSIAFVESRIWPLDFPDLNGDGNKFRAMDMTWAELSEYEEKLQKEKQDISRDIDLYHSAFNLNKARPGDDERLKALLNDRKERDRQIFSIHSEWHLRPALALGCFCFALVGCPVGIWFSKSDYLSAFITCFLPIVIIYYPMMFCMMNMANTGKLPPWMGIYNADAIMLATGWILFRRLARN
jgi:lipopolysaccharide export system permease protein